MKNPVLFSLSLLIACTAYPGIQSEIAENTSDVHFTRPLNYNLGETGQKSDVSHHNSTFFDEQNSQQNSREIINLLFDGIKNLKRQNTISTSRTFLTVESYRDKSTPISVFEAFYQANLSNGKSIDDLQLKNGRCAKVITDGQNNHSQFIIGLLKGYDLFDNNNDALRLYSPFNMGKSQSKNKFDIGLAKRHLKNGESFSKIYFRPKTDHPKLCSGFVIINDATKIIKSVELSTSPNNLDGRDGMKDLNVMLSFYFKENPDKQVVFDKINMTYDYKGVHYGQLHSVTTLAEMTFYNYDDKFLLPLCFPPELNSDEEKLLALPYNDQLWTQEYCLIWDKKQANKISQISTEGILINYGSDEINNPHTDCPFIYWSEQNRLNWKDLPGAAITDKNQVIQKNHKENHEHDYKLGFYIIADCNKQGDSIYPSCHTVFYNKNSYFHGERNDVSLEFINLQFDLVESFRRQMHQTICKRGRVIDDMQALKEMYMDYMQRLQEMLQEMSKDVNHGKDLQKMEIWRSRIDRELHKERII